MVEMLLRPSCLRLYFEIEARDPRIILVISNPDSIEDFQLGQTSLISYSILFNRIQHLDQAAIRNKAADSLSNAFTKEP